MRFHIPCIVGQPTIRSNSSCAYTQKIVKFSKMMVERGHEVFIYGNTQNDATCTKHFDVYGDTPYDGFDVVKWEPHNQVAAKAIKENWQDGDFLLLIAGLAQKSIADKIDTFRVVEFGIGYEGVFSMFKVWESYAWMHLVYGMQKGAYNADGEWYDIVIPNYFDTEDFDLGKGDGDYYLYIGRVLERKGVEVAAQVCEKLDKKLIIAGGADESYTPSYGECIGSVGPEERNELMGGAIATFVPTIYVEPFGGVHAESMFCGTPVITTDWGVFSETVIDHYNGYRCRTFGDFLYAAKNSKSLSRDKIREYAINKFSLDAVAETYENYFKQVDDLSGLGWYEEKSRKFG